MGKSPEAIKSRENYESFKIIVADAMKKEKEKEALAKPTKKK